MSLYEIPYYIILVILVLASIGNGLDDEDNEK